jgi:transporter family-2 protein
MDMLWLTIAVAAGGCIAVQAAANGSLRSAIDSPWHAAFYSICGTMVTALLFMLAARPAAPALAAVRSTPWWNWVGGPLGGIIVLTGAALVPKIGSATFIASFVAGQLVVSLLLDHFGLMDLPQQSISPGRLAGAAMVFAGMLLVRYS